MTHGITQPECIAPGESCRMTYGITPTECIAPGESCRMTHGITPTECIAHAESWRAGRRAGGDRGAGDGWGLNPARKMRGKLGNA
jgi:hypothetical protein